MPAYHFHVYEGREVLDHEGTDLANLQAAYGEAMQFAGELLIHEGERLMANGGCLIVVKDGNGEAQFRLDLKVTLEPLKAVACPLSVLSRRL